MKKKIGFFVGSLRKGSYSKTVAVALSSLFPEEYEPIFIDLHELTMYNQDLDDDGTPPASWTKFREEVKQLAGLVFVTPEYNRSVPAVLKNALDVGSRPYGQNVWDSKPGLVVSVSPGALSGFGANHHLRQSLVFLNVPTLQQPEAYIGNVVNLINDNGTIAENTIGFFKTIIDAYLVFLEKNS
ncbi:NADPH-dependent FMN reductase [Enterococcus rotai]|uniref:NADPH-dependent FMN reductase n=1 Tax=Enterococcus rotai TaxID=118060 RepID=UPI0032B3DA74